MRDPLDGWGVMERAVELSRRGEEFALATVVWRMGPSSGQDGGRAIVTHSGEVHGWVGGACAEPVLIRAAREVIASGQAQLLWLGQAHELEELHVPAGVQTVPISCQSDGALQLFIEPAHSAPRLVVVGRSPMATTLEQLARALDWNVVLADHEQLADGTIDQRSMVVVATQGHGDEDVLEQVLAANPVYVGLVASRARGDAVIGYLADRGLAREQLDRVRFPVGLDLGHTTHREIAVAILAELVQHKASGALAGSHHEVPGAGTLPQVEEAIDPVCGMTVDAIEANRPFVHEGTTYYFCCPGCHRAFSKDPESFLKQEAR